MYESPLVLIFSRPCRSTSPSNWVYSRSRKRTKSVGAVSLARRVKPAISAKRTDASSYLSAMTVRDGSFNRWAIVVGKMLASSDSDLLYSASIALSARVISRSAYQTVATTISHAEATDTANPTVKAQAGCTPVDLG